MFIERTTKSWTDKASYICMLRERGWPSGLWDNAAGGVVAGVDGELALRQNCVDFWEETVLNWSKCNGPVSRSLLIELIKCDVFVR